MTGYTLTPAAQDDLDGIWDYTAATWGEEQAVRYLEGLRDACRELAQGERQSRPVDVRAGYRKCQVGQHVLFFQTADTGGIIVVRILHQRMDVSRHL
jgi:toxin ParE1/3/4